MFSGWQTVGRCISETESSNKTSYSYQCLFLVRGRIVPYEVVNSQYGQFEEYSANRLFKEIIRGIMSCLQSSPDIHWCGCRLMGKRRGIRVGDWLQPTMPRRLRSILRQGLGSWLGRHCHPALRTMQYTGHIRFCTRQFTFDKSINCERWLLQHN